MCCQATALFYSVLVIESFHLGIWGVICAVLGLATTGFVKLNEATDNTVTQAGAGVFIGLTVGAFFFFLLQLAAVFWLSMGHHKRSGSHMMFYIVWNVLFHVILTNIPFVLFLVYLDSAGLKVVFGGCLGGFLALAFYCIWVAFMCRMEYNNTYNAGTRTSHMQMRQY